MGLIHELGRSSKGGHGNLLQYSCLKNPMDRWAWWAAVHRIAESWMWLSMHTWRKYSLAIIKKSANNKCWRRCREKGTLHCWECKFVQPLWTAVWKFLKKLKIKLPYDPAIPFLGIYLEKMLIWKATCTPVSIASLFTITKTWKQPKYPSTDEWIKKMWYIYIT